jgi:hypothetical protein
MSPLTFKVYRRIVGNKEEMIASFRFENDATMFMHDLFSRIAYRYHVKGSRVVVKFNGRIRSKKECG